MVTKWLNQFYQQQSKAKIRGIEFKLTFEQWLGVWTKSGKLEQRGRLKNQFVMARFQDKGAYEIGNIEIITVSENLSMIQSKANTRVPNLPIEHIRRAVFHVSQSEFAEISGTTQSSVSRWEQGLQEPSHSEMDRIRTAAADRGIRWDDRWFFEPPKPARSARN